MIKLAAKDYLKGITVEIGGNTTGLSKALSDVNKDINSLQKEINTVHKLLQNDPGNTWLRNQKIDLLKKEIEEVSNKLKTLQSVQEEVAKQFQNNEISPEAYRAFQREVYNTEVKLSDLKKEADKTAKGTDTLGNEVKKSGDSANESGKKFETFGKVVSGVGSAVGKAAAAIAKTMAAAVAGIAAGITTVVKKSIDAGIEFESAFAGVKKTVDATDEQLVQLKNDIRQMALEIPATTTEIAAVAEAAGQMGIEVDNIMEFTRVMVDLGVSTNLSATEAAMSIAKFANITKMSADDYGRFGSTIVELGNNFATTERDIMAMTMRLASTGEVVGLTEAQMIAVATSLSAVGIEAQAGGSAISKLMKKMEVSVKTYDTAKKAIDATGMSLRELELLKNMNSKTFKSVADDIGLTGVELQKFMDQAKGLEAFADVANMSAEQFIQAWGDDAVVAMDTFISGLDEAERLGKSSIEVLDEMGLTEIRLSNAILALSTSNNILTKSVNMANEAWDDNTALTKEASQRYETLESRIQVMKNGFNDLLISIHKGNDKTLKGMVDKATGYINQLSADFKENGFAGLVEAVGPIIADIITEITNALPSLIETSTTILKAIGDALKNNLPVITSAATDIMLMLVDTIIKGLPELIKTAIEIIKTLANGLMERLPEIIKAALDIIMTLVNALIDNLPDIIEAGIKIIIELVKGLTESLPKLIPAAVKALLTIVETLLDNLDLIIDCAIDLVFALIDGIMDALPILIEKAPEIIGKLITAIIEALPKLLMVGPKLIIKLAEGIVKAAPQLLKAGAELLFNVIKGIADAIPKVVETAKDIVKNIWDTITKTDWIQLGKDILSGIWNGLMDFGKKVADFGKGIVDGFKDFFGINSPSTLFDKEIGVNLAKGVGVGFSKEMKSVNKEMQKAINTDYNLAVNTAFRHANAPTAGVQDYELVIPIDIGGNKFARTVSRLQYDVNQGKMRVAGVSVG
ncbi:MAG: phage tail tape measure protein [Oscillospiraceae bacterium]|nr:phage tail tape measure protein [Oscillospiraceae bacterium]